MVMGIPGQWERVPESMNDEEERKEDKKRKGQSERVKKQGRINGTPVADGWAGTAK